MNWKDIAYKVIRNQPKPPPSKNGMYKILGNWMYLDDKDSLNLSKYGVYERKETEFIRKWIKPSFTVVDIGANIGYYTLIMAGLAKHVYAFEPDPSNFDLLTRNVVLNKITNATLYNKAVSDKTGKLTLHLCDFNRGMHRVYPSQWCKEQLEIETVRLDDMVESTDFIKMDIEGAELGALKGMSRLLEKGTTVLMEFHPYSIIEYGARPSDVYNYMKSFGYRIMLMDEEKEIKYEVLEKRAMKMIARDKLATNILCIKENY